MREVYFLVLKKTKTGHINKEKLTSLPTHPINISKIGRVGEKEIENHEGEKKKRTCYAGVSALLKSNHPN